MPTLKSNKLPVSLYSLMRHPQYTTSASMREEKTGGVPQKDHSISRGTLTVTMLKASVVGNQVFLYSVAQNFRYCQEKLSQRQNYIQCCMQLFHSR